MNKNTEITIACLLVSTLNALTVNAADQLVARAILPAATFAQGPTSGQQLGTEPINGQAVPFDIKTVQGFSAGRSQGLQSRL